MSLSEVMGKIRANDSKLADKIIKQGYCIVDADVESLTKIDRLMKVLVKCGNGRFSCPVQDVKHFIKIVDESGLDHIRSVELLIN